MYQYYLKLLDNNSLQPSITLDEKNQLFQLQLLLPIESDTVNLSLQIVYYTVLISNTPNCGFSCSMGLQCAKLHILVRVYINHPGSFSCCDRLHTNNLVGNNTSAFDYPNLECQLWILCMIQEYCNDKLAFN